VEAFEITGSGLVPKHTVDVAEHSVVGEHSHDQNSMVVVLRRLTSMA
jgi:hypothetical protein